MKLIIHKYVHIDKMYAISLHSETVIKTDGGNKKKVALCGPDEMGIACEVLDKHAIEINQDLHGYLVPVNITPLAFVFNIEMANEVLSKSKVVEILNRYLSNDPDASSTMTFYRLPFVDRLWEESEIDKSQLSTYTKEEWNVKLLFKEGIVLNFA